MRCGDSTSFATSGFSSRISCTIEPIGSSTSGIQSSSRSGILELWLLSAGPPRQLARDADEQDGKELSEHVLRQGFRQLRAADGRGDRREADDERGTPANVCVALL